MKLYLENHQSPGDILMLTAAVRDLKKQYPNIEIKVNTSAILLWNNNPYINQHLKREDCDKIIKIGYPLINSSDKLPYHFIHAFRKELELQLGLSITQGEFKGDIHMIESEKKMFPLLNDNEKYWIIDAGYKTDFTLKNWGIDRYQKVVDMLKDKVKFVQIRTFRKHSYT